MACNLIMKTQDNQTSSHQKQRAKDERHALRIKFEKISRQKTHTIHDCFGNKTVNVVNLDYLSRLFTDTYRNKVIVEEVRD